ncbi:uncharacterized protein ColSpa_05831 [Colletotrichum spaethianum]|uniref:Uncharacterized protein n=1 Tax=Colletotrichum spaethianum TaxID=700344 RepID=A0AA37P0I2_9PEZI|nr:uncharacterized protein ColSpa_05831 [Colletotrichum spaethianum]GKT45650.1 hypothetical protein ColSpa_05831 [Colletotrichum spaethianum]
MSLYSHALPSPSQSDPHQLPWSLCPFPPCDIQPRPLQMCIPRPRRHRAQTYTSPLKNIPYQRLASPPPTPRMAPRPIPAPVPVVAAAAGAAAPLPHPSASRVSSQHERLLLELLPFKDAAAFHAWLGSHFVRGSWNEFYADYLSRAVATGAGPSSVPEPDKTRTAQTAREALNVRKAKFLVHHPDKTGWAAEDHYARFIVTLVADNMLQNLWSESEWKKRGLDIAKAAYEVLVFLKATMVYADPNPPSYSA